MSDKSSPHPERLGKELAAGIRDGDVVGLGSGSTVARLLPVDGERHAERGRGGSLGPDLAPDPARRAGTLAPRTARSRRPDIVKVVDGADQVDGRLNLIKGGGGALLKEKVLLGSTEERRHRGGREEVRGEAVHERRPRPRGGDAVREGDGDPEAQARREQGREDQARPERVSRATPRTGTCSWTRSSRPSRSPSSSRASSNRSRVSSRWGYS